LYHLFAKQFVAGETFDEALPKIQALRKLGMDVTVDILGESVTTPTQIKANTDAYRQLIANLAEQNIPINISVKLSAIGLNANDPVDTLPDAFGPLEGILLAAQQHMRSFVRVDMEQYRLKDPTLQLVRIKHWRHPRRIGPVLQAALFDTRITDLPRAVAAGLRIRLCKGSYAETATVAHQNPRAIRSAYMLCAEHMLQNGADFPAFATHDGVLIDHIKRFAKTEGIAQNAFEFQMLYGVRTKLQQQLVDEGYNVRIYVPYGQDWWKYFRRRLKEGKRRQILLLLLRSALHI